MSMRWNKCMLPGVLGCCLRLSVHGDTLETDAVKADEVILQTLSFRPTVTTDAFAHYRFVTSATVTNDTTANKNILIRSSAVWSATGYAGGVGGGLSFDGTADYVYTPTARAVTPMPTWNAYSVSMWFFHNGGGKFDATHYHPLLDKSTTKIGTFLALDPTGISGPVGSLTFQTFGVTPICSMRDATKNYMDNTWHHVVLIKNDSNGQLWVDGELKDQTSDLACVTNTSGLFFGRRSTSFESGSTAPSWSGLMDEIQIFKRALEPSEVTNLFVHNGPFPLKTALEVTTNLTVNGDVHVGGRLSFTGEKMQLRASGDVECGIFSNGVTVP